MNRPEVLWVDLQPTLYCLNKRVSQRLSRDIGVKRWSFQLDPDEFCMESTVHSMLKTTLESMAEPIHLIGHGLSGIISCEFAHNHPELVESVTLLSVDTLSINQWSSHYLGMRRQLACSREQILKHLSTLLFEVKSSQVKAAFPRLLQACLDNELIQGSIVNLDHPGSLSSPQVPTLVINGHDDFVVDRMAQQRWEEQLKPGDCYHSLQGGRHFFQFSHAELTATLIRSFLDMVPGSSAMESLHPSQFTTSTQQQA